MLGGNPPGTGIEIHDVVFTVGATIEDTREQMLAAWFADGPAPHIDSWMELDIVDGMQVTLSTEAPTETELAGPDLWHVNLGYYEPGKAGFMEGHENLFVVAPTAAEAKKRAKQSARRAASENLHTDAIHRISDWLQAQGLHIRVKIVKHEGVPTGGETMPIAHDGYQPFPEEFLQANRQKK